MGGLLAGVAGRRVPTSTLSVHLMSHPMGRVGLMVPRFVCFPSSLMDLCSMCSCMVWLPSHHGQAAHSGSAPTLGKLMRLIGACAHVTRGRCTAPVARLRSQ